MSPSGDGLRSRLRGIAPLRGAVVGARLWRSRTRSFLKAAGFPELPPEDVVRTVYQVMLRREPDEGAVAQYVDAVRFGHVTAWDLVDRVRSSDEFRCRTPIGGPSLLQSLHLSRCEFIIGLPPARTIVDLGGSHTHSPWGGLVLMGYPYEFDDLVVVDLPPEDRHDLYRSEAWRSVHTPKGPARYEFRSMTDLSFAGDATVDLVYSGQSIEHVTADEAKVVMAEVLRVLRPGGVFAVDTPNAAVCRVQSPEFIDPDHKIEYTADHLLAVMRDAGFEIDEVKGLNLARQSLATGVFDEGEVAANCGVHAEAASCYLLAVVARKPATGA